MTILLTLAFCAGFFIVFSVNMLMTDLFDRRQQQIRERLEHELQTARQDKARGSLDQKTLYELAAAGSVDLSARVTLRERFELFVDQTGAKVNPQRVAVFAAIGGLAAGIATAAVTRPAIGLLAAPVGAAIPVAYLWFLRARRIKRLQSQLPDVFDLMSRTLRAGRTIPQAFQSVAEEFSRPAAEEFGYAHEQQKLGLSPEVTMHELARRTGLLELKIFVMAVMIHHQTGGNLADLLERLSNIIRERFRIRGMIRALTAEGRLQATILLMMPPFLLTVIMIINQPYAEVLFEFPGMLAGVAAFMIFGAVWMHRIISFDF